MKCVWLTCNSSYSCVSAPLNPAYSSGEVEFYLSDASAKLFIVPRSAVKANTQAVQAAKKLGVAIAEVWWDAGTSEVALEVVWESGKQRVASSVKGSGKPTEDDVALLLHTSGTTGRPKAVPLTHRNLVTTMRNITNTYRLKHTDRTFLVMPLVRLFYSTTFEILLNFEGISSMSTDFLLVSWHLCIRAALR
jgi:long-subunit acyl-CoA synthetase (AMP-forming)